jgi:6-O-methylguanine DNA methyltransferase, DNA binding domain
MAYKKKSWQEKLTDKKNLPKILKLQKSFPCYNAVHKMGAEAGDDVVLVNPSEVVSLMRQVSKGKLITLAEICKTIAKKHHVKGCCSLTTGIFIMTAANATEEAANQGKSLDIPYWRTLKADGFLNEKYPGGALAQKKLLEQEGFTILKKGKKFVVYDFEKYLTEVKY